MNKQDCFLLGHVAKLHGYKGEVIIYLDVDHPNEYHKLESVFVEINQLLVPFFIDKIELKDKGFARVQFEDVTTEEKARTMLRCDLYLPIQQLPSLNDNQFYYHEIIGFSVIDEEKGPIGKVDMILEFPQNPVLQIKKDFNEILVPINDSTIQNVNREEKTITVRAPEGLIDIYLQ
jgi:16S rRNA processing protein RimM